MSNAEEFASAKDRESKIKIVQRIAKPYPNREAREFFEGAYSGANIRKPNPDGCDNKDCRKGYSGRVGIYEVLEFEKSVKRFINDASKPLVDMEDFLSDRGFVSMRMYGLVLVIMGTISYDDFDASVE